jgi:hypothetical protein
MLIEARQATEACFEINGDQAVSTATFRVQTTLPRSMGGTTI